jgi:hypothetical protein
MKSCSLSGRAFPKSLMSGSKDPPDFYSQGLKDNRICKLSRPYTVIASDRRARGDLGGNASGSISMSACSFLFVFLSELLCRTSSQRRKKSGGVSTYPHFSFQTTNSQYNKNILSSFSWLLVFSNP